MPSCRTIAVADFVHMGFTKEYTSAYPSARVIGPQGTSKKLGIEAAEFTGNDATDAKVLGEGVIAKEMKAEYFGSFVNKVRYVRDPVGKEC